MAGTWSAWELEWELELEWDLGVDEELLQHLGWSLMRLERRYPLFAYTTLVLDVTEIRTKICRYTPRLLHYASTKKVRSLEHFRDRSVTRLDGAYFIWLAKRTHMLLLGMCSMISCADCLGARTPPQPFHQGSAPSPSPKHLPFLVFPSPRKAHHRPCTTHPTESCSDPASLPGATQLSPSTNFPPLGLHHHHHLGSASSCINIALLPTSSLHDGRPHLSCRHRRFPRGTRPSSALLRPAPVERGDRPPMAGSRWVCQSDVSCALGPVNILDRPCD